VLHGRDCFLVEEADFPRREWSALLVVLAPTIVAIGDEFDASVGAVGQARSITAALAIG